MKSSEIPSAEAGETGIPKTKVLIQIMAQANTRHLSLHNGRKLGKKAWAFFRTRSPGRSWGPGGRGKQIYISQEATQEEQMRKSNNNK